MPPVRRTTKKKKREKHKEPIVEKSPDAPTDLDWWQELSNKLTSSGTFTSADEDKNFKSFLRMSRATFDYIVSLVKYDMLTQKSTGYFMENGRIITVEKQVAIALRRLSSGESQHSVGESFDVGQSIVSQATWKFVEAMEEKGLHHLKWPDSNEMEGIKAKFESIGGLANCCGVIDTSHIIMSLPVVDASNIWLDSEENYSMVMQAIIDPDLKFRDVLTGWPGSMNDYCVLKSSGFYKLCDSGQRLNGPPKDLKTKTKVREYIVGDVGYPLLPWLLTPYQGKDLSSDRREFNAKHHATHSVSERALARFKGTWRIIQGVMWRPDKHKLPRIILVCCLLHNIIIDREDELNADVPLAQYHDSGYKQQHCQYADKDGQNVRDTLAIYLLQRPLLS